MVTNSPKLFKLSWEFGLYFNLFNSRLCVCISFISTNVCVVHLWFEVLIIHLLTLHNTIHVEVPNLIWKTKGKLIRFPTFTPLTVKKIVNMLSEESVYN